MTHRSHELRTDLLLALATLLLGGLLLAVGSGLVAQWHEASARHENPSAGDLLGAAAAIAGSVLLAWWLLSFLAATAGILLERQGRIRAASVTSGLSPAFMRRLVIAGVSFNLVSGAAANAATTAPGPQWAPTQEYAAAAQETSGPPVPELEVATAQGTAAPDAETRVQQTSPPGSTPPSTAPGATAPAAPDLPAAGNARAGTPPLEPGWRPSAAPMVDPGLLAGHASRQPATSAAAAAYAPEPVAVHAGDTLWDIVRNQLGVNVSDVDIALEWPRWYEANRAVIGQDPDVLLPGQVLQPPLPL